MSLRPTLLLLLAAAGCSSYEFPRLTVPQVQNTVEMVEGQGDRFSTHRSCVAASPELDSLLKCMDDAGFRFLPRVPEYPSHECWQLRERGGADLPPAYCWERVAANPPTP
jgi:hypothetical protein